MPYGVRVRIPSSPPFHTMIQTISGNLLDCPNGINAIIHSANTRRGGTHGAGIAAQIVRRWPIVQKESENHFLKTRKDLTQKNGWADYEDVENFLLGTVLEISIEKNLSLFNLYGQHLYRFSKFKIPTDYSAFQSGAKKISEICSQRFLDGKLIPVVGIPFGIGCGLGGGEWKYVEYIFQNAFKSAEYPVFFVKL